MQRGKITILIIVFVAVAAAFSSVWYHFRNQQQAQQFWGTQTALLIDKAPQVEVLTLGEAERGLSLEAEEEPREEAPAAKGSEKSDEAKNEAEAPPEPTAKALEFNGTPWMVTATKDAATAKGIANLRRALVLDTTYDWAEPPAAQEPRWQYGLGVEDGHNWATVLFDFDSRQVGLAGGRKTALMNPEANAEFKGFFAEQFKEASTDATPQAQPEL